MVLTEYNEELTLRNRFLHGKEEGIKEGKLMRDGMILQITKEAREKNLSSEEIIARLDEIVKGGKK